MGKDLLGSDTQIATARIYFIVAAYNTFQRGEHLPHQLAMNGTGVKLEVAPAVANVVTIRFGAIEPEENEGLFHHLLCLERYR